MQQQRFVVEQEYAGRTVVRVVHDLAGISHAIARGILAAGGILRNGRKVTRTDERVEPGDRIELSYEPGRRYRDVSSAPRGEGYRIVHEDREVVVADKEAGLLTVPAPAAEGDSLLERLTASYRARGHRDTTVLAVHRIDRYTSGLVAFARTGPAYAALRAQFAAGLPERIYMAVATGTFEGDRGTLEHHLTENPKSLKVHPTPRGPHARRAACTYEIVERFERTTLLRVKLQTGRRNQIRVQLSAIGHALVGDHTYGTPSQLIARTALHAARLAFDHPVTKERIALDSPIPPDLAKLLTTLRRGNSL